MLLALARPSSSERPKLLALAMLTLARLSWGQRDGSGRGAPVQESQQVHDAEKGNDAEVYARDKLALRGMGRTDDWEVLVVLDSGRRWRAMIEFCRVVRWAMQER